MLLKNTKKTKSGFKGCPSFPWIVSQRWPRAIPGGQINGDEASARFLKDPRGSHRHLEFRFLFFPGHFRGELVFKKLGRTSHCNGGWGSYEGTADRMCNQGRTNSSAPHSRRVKAKVIEGTVDKK